MSSLSRRAFIRNSLLAAGGTTALSTVHARPVIGRQRALGRPLGANDRIRLAVAGIHKQGAEHIKHYAQLSKSHNVEIVYLVDPDSRLFDSRIKMVEEIFSTQTCVLIRNIPYKRTKRVYADYTIFFSQSLNLLVGEVSHGISDSPTIGMGGNDRLLGELHHIPETFIIEMTDVDKHA